MNPSPTREEKRINQKYRIIGACISGLALAVSVILLAIYK